MCQTMLHTEISGLIKSSRRDRASCLRIKSRACGPSPAIFPKAHTACSLTKGETDLSSFTNFNTAPCSITFCVCSDVPEAIFVNTHAASNCKRMLDRNNKNYLHKCTNLICAHIHTYDCNPRGQCTVVLCHLVLYR